MKNQNFEMYAGDTKDIVVSVTDSGRGANLTGATINWVLKSNVSSLALVNKSTSNGITLGDGEFTIRLNRADTLILLGRYYHEGEITDSIGNVTTVMSGVISILASGV